MNVIIGGDQHEFENRFREMRPKIQTQLTVLPLDHDEHDEFSNRVIAGVKRLFRLRHMYCHEIDPVVREIEWIKSGAQAAIEFIRTSEAIVNDLLSGQSTA